MSRAFDEVMEIMLLDVLRISLVGYTEWDELADYLLMFIILYG